MGKICHVAGCSGAAGFRQGAPAARERANAARAEAVKSAQASFLAAEAVGGEYSHPYPYYTAKEYLELA